MNFSFVFDVKLKKVLKCLRKALLCGAVGTILFLLLALIWDPWWRPNLTMAPFPVLNYWDPFIFPWVFFFPLFLLYGFCLFFSLSILLDIVGVYCTPIKVRFIRHFSFISLQLWENMAWSALMGLFLGYFMMALIFYSIYNEVLFHLVVPFLSVYTAGMIQFFHLEGSKFALGLEAVNWLFSGSYVLAFLATFIYRYFNQPGKKFILKNNTRKA